MLILRAIRTLALVFSTQAQMWVGRLLLPAHTRPLFKAKGRGLIALHWRALAVDCELAAAKAPRSPVAERTAETATPRCPDAAPAVEPLESPRWATRVGLLAGHSADQALAAHADAEMLHGELYEALLTFAATPGRYPPAQTAPPGGS